MFVLCLLSADQNVSSQLQLQHHAGLPVVMFLAVMVMDSPSENVSTMDSLLEVVLVMVSYYRNKKVTRPLYPQTGSHEKPGLP